MVIETKSMDNAPCLHIGIEVDRNKLIQNASHKLKV
jgi:hypothetical protein